MEEGYDGAGAAGAVGGKLLGAGGGGFLLMYVEPDNQNAVRTVLHDLQEVSFRFDHKGSSIIFFEP